MSSNLGPIMYFELNCFALKCNLVLSYVIIKDRWLLSWVNTFLSHWALWKLKQRQWMKQLS